MKSSKPISEHSKALAADWRKIKNAFSDTAIDVADMAEDVMNTDLQQPVKDYTQKKPLQALGIAVAIGFVLGCWWKR